MKLFYHKRGLKSKSDKSVPRLKFEFIHWSTKRCLKKLEIAYSCENFANVFANNLQGRVFFGFAHLVYVKALFKAQQERLLALGNFILPLRTGYINLACLSVCFGVCLFVSNKRQNGSTDRAQIFCGNSRYPKKGLWMIKFSKICLSKFDF